MNKKTFLSLLALCLCCLTVMQFAACNNGNTTEETTPEQSEQPAPEDTTDQEESSSEQTTEESTTEPDTSSGVAAKPSINFDTALNVTENGSNATVTTATGLAYAATGFSKVQDGKFMINQNYTVTLDQPVTDEFNRLTVCFVSDAPLKCTVTYKVGSKTVDDLFYLEAGKQTFCALTKDYLAGKKATELTSISFSTCENKQTAFALCDVKTELYEVYAKEVYYIENEYYKLGVRLSWGGGICYLKDLKKSLGGIDNLINQADTGRLVQQSYYGTYSNGDYVEGDYNGVRWPYNPVQGGDVHGNPSRIIDIVVGENSLYVKAQPQDWGHNGDLTISYMENTYILEENYVRVDNRFVDFSGWEHRYASQELPAFYTLSYFGDFTYYGGSKSWEDQALTTKKNLQFWGDPQYNSDCTFRMRNSNTETWCAWTNSMTNYGIGLYVPNVDTLLAGRHAYNGSKDSLNGATNYVAPLCTLKIVSFEAIEYSYMMTTGSLEQIRETFKVNKDFATNESLHKNYLSDRIEDEGAAVSMQKIEIVDLNSAMKLKATNNTAVSFSDAEQAAALTIATAFDPHVTIDYTKSSPVLKAEDYTTICITYMIPTTNSQRSYNAELFLCTGSTMGAEGGKSVRAQVVADGEYHVLEISVANLSFWSGNVNAIRFDYFDNCAEGDVMYVRSIELK